MPSVPLVRVVRSDVVESIHRGSVAVCDAEGALVLAAGDPGAVVFARSTTKPLQAAVSLGRIPDQLPDAEVAVMAASHNAEPEQIEAVREILARAALGEEALRCPPAQPRWVEDARRVHGPRPLLHNCSGKHAGMLLACVRSGLDPASYPAPAHPLQREVLAAITEAAGGPPVALGVDGCGVPVHAYPLVSLAIEFARLGRPETLPDPLRGAAQAVLAAMRARPGLVAGRDRVCTALMTAAPVVAKVGAEGLICVALPERGLGLALKVEDGGDRGRDVAIVHALALLEAADPAAEELRPFAQPAVLGGGEPVGDVVADFSLTPP